MIDKARGKDIVFLTAIFQSSPLILITKQNSNIDSIEKFKGKKAALTAVETSASIFGMLSSNGIRKGDIKLVTYAIMNLKIF